MSTVAASFITWDSEIMAQAELNTILGIGIVFLVLLLISFIISCFKYVNKFSMGRQAEAPEPSAAPEPAVVEEEEEVVDDLEIVAVIMAAIEAYEEETGGYVPADGLVVRSIKKVNKQRWQNA